MELLEIIATDNNSTQPDSTKALIAGINEETYAIPLSSVLTIEKVNLADINKVESEDVIYLRERIIPLVYLDKLFKIESAGANDGTITVVVCMQNDACFGLVVDKLYGQQDIFTKSMGILNDNEFFAGASILENDVALILNIQSFAA
ncbi:chemotaxis protein CheW [Butyrivibrio sp. VCD2006]|uniref:chemotaxis protein CheW n=1 Tax=Butyrivibrio sp. VCD2006 TaxID=1280664 RepID=UPI00040B3DD6|nr:chemotaxis protein CheW [Butyrivibrio sp. VCD2006]